jgi:hypothetical protein
VRIKNYGTAVTFIHVDIKGWFSDPQAVIPP